MTPVGRRQRHRRHRHLTIGTRRLGHRRIHRRHRRTRHAVNTTGTSPSSTTLGPPRRHLVGPPDPGRRQRRRHHHRLARRIRPRRINRVGDPISRRPTPTSAAQHPTRHTAWVDRRRHRRHLAHDAPTNVTVPRRRRRVDPRPPRRHLPHAETVSQRRRHRHRRLRRPVNGPGRIDHVGDPRRTSAGITVGTVTSPSVHVACVTVGSTGDTGVHDHAVERHRLRRRRRDVSSTPPARRATRPRPRQRRRHRHRLTPAHTAPPDHACR